MKDAMTQLPKQIYDMIRQHEQIPIVPTKATDDLIYYQTVIESLCKLIRTIQQGQRTSLVSMARVIQEQNDIIQTYQELAELPDQMTQMTNMQRKLQKQVQQIKVHTDLQLERIDKESISIDTKVSDIKSRLKKVENSMTDNGTNRTGWVDIP